MDSSGQRFGQMEGTPLEVDLASVTEALEAMGGVADAHHVHAWPLTSDKYIFSGHVRLEKGSESQAVLRAAQRILRQGFGLFFETLQVEAACLDESGAGAIDVTAQT